MTTHSFDIDALNAICVSLGGNGGHRMQIDALNEWCTKAGKAAGHTRSINAYNLLAGGTSYAFDLQAMNDLSGDKGGATNAISGISALNTIADKIAVPAGPPELAFLDFVNGVYRLNGAPIAIGDLMMTDPDDNYGPFDPNFGITEVGLTGGDPFFTPAALAVLLAQNGLTVVGTAGIDTLSIQNAGIEVFQSPDWDVDWQSTVGLSDDVRFPPVIKLRANGDMQTTPGITGAGVVSFALTVVPGRASMSVNGGTVVTLAGTGTWSTANAIVIINDGNGFIQQMTFHPPQPDAALPGLSA